MNRVKLLYEVVKTMKEKETWQGRFTVHASKDQATIFKLDNEFEKQLANGATKLKVHVELDADGKKMSHDSNTEFNFGAFQDQHHSGFHESMHCRPGIRGIFHLHPMHCSPEQDIFQHQQHFRFHRGNFKEGLSRLAFLLNLFDQIKLETKTDQSFILSLQLKELPQEFHEMMRHKMSKAGFGPHEDDVPAHLHWIKEFHKMENPDGEVQIFVTSRFEVEKVIWRLNGKQREENQSEHDLKVDGELNFIW